MSYKYASLKAVFGVCVRIASLCSYMGSGFSKSAFHGFLLHAEFGWLCAVLVCKIYFLEI